MSRRLAEGIPAEPAEEAVSVTAVIALGANLGDRAEALAQAVEELRALPFVAEVRVAEAIETVAVRLEGPDADAPRYLNTVALCTTTLAPAVLLGELHEIERRHGRVRREPWGDRTLDLDLIAYGDLRSDDPALLLPHPRAAERDFVLIPWLRLDPDAVLPGHGRVDALLAAREEGTSS